MTTKSRTTPPDTAQADATTPTTAAHDPRGLAQIFAEMQPFGLVLPPTDRTDSEIEADFDNMPI